MTLKTQRQAMLFSIKDYSKQFEETPKVLKKKQLQPQDRKRRRLS